MSIFFSSDHHFYHSNVISYCNRPFKTVEEMNEKMILAWNETVGQDDVVFYLGDFSMARRPVEIITPRLNGQKFLIPGNHDHCWPGHKKARGDKLKDQNQFYVDCGWVVLPTRYRLNLTETVIANLCHLPYLGDSTDNRHNAHRLKDEKVALICGHVHQHWQSKKTPENTLMVNVGVDAWDFKPVPIETLIGMIEACNDLQK